VHHIYRKLFCQLESRVYRQLPANDSYWPAWELHRWRIESLSWT
jgi:hypothetical protein